MENLALKFFPYPHVLQGERREGMLVQWPARCRSGCDRQCEAAEADGLQLCSYGVNYQRVDDDLLIAGVVVRDFPAETKAWRKMRASVGVDAITRLELERVVERCAESTTEIEAELRNRLDTVVAEYRESKGYQQDVLKALKPHLEETLAQVHDYKQFVQQIIQNVDVMLESRYPGLEIDEKLEKATAQEAAIYWTAAMMDEKLDAALFLESPKRIYEKREQGVCRLHGMVLKYTRIYQSRADRKRLHVSVVGDSWGEIAGNTRALGIVPHTLIDNAMKYAPDGSSVIVGFEETAQAITLSVKSKGPRIREQEKDRIFDLFYRGSAARRRYKEGTGFGLASAQNIARAHGTEIQVDQAPEGDRNGDYETTFSVRFERAKGARSEQSGAFGRGRRT